MNSSKTRNTDSSTLFVETHFMDVAPLAASFARMGARLKIVDRPTRRRGASGPLSLDVQSDRKGEFYELFSQAEVEPEVHVLDLRPGDRHLLLLVREEDDSKSKFLCGHDERHWFVAGVPEAAPVGNVPQAMEALKPPAVRAAQSASKLRSNTFNRRKNDAFVRQGEWFFVPQPQMTNSTDFALRNERLVRTGGGKPHFAEYCLRFGGEAVRVCPQRPDGLLDAEYRRLLARTPSAAKWNWRIMVRNAGVYVAGRIRHADHKTIRLDGWHQVMMNTEGESKAMRHVAFLD